MGRLLGRVWVIFTTSLIAFIAYSSQIFVIWPWYRRVLSVELLQLLLPFNFLVGMLYWNYYLCVKTDPGRVPKEWKPDVRSDDGYEVKRLTGGPRFCRNCNVYKPPRAHHCSQCRRCVLRMDHHCPWVNNCVGHFNYGHFIRFLFFVDVSCSYHLAMITRRSFDVLKTSYWDGPSTVEFVFLVLNYVACVPVILAVGAFSLYHFYCLATNTTTVEGWEKDKVAMLVRRGKIHEVKFPYNIGLWENIQSTLGRNPLLWCCPSVPAGTGLKYRVADGHDSDEQNSWPPPDPNDNRRTDPNYDDDDHELTLPSSPWTYENGDLNPNLSPSNALRPPSTARRRRPAVANVPPYHPDYVEPTSAQEEQSDGYESVSEIDSDEYRYNVGGPGHIVRRGSEGYEVRPVDREEILRRYIMNRGEEAGRYKRYVPEPGSDSDSGVGEWEGGGDELPAEEDDSRVQNGAINPSPTL